MTELGTTSVSSHQGSSAQRLNQLRDVAGEVVGSVFYGKLLQTLRDSSLKGQYGHGGRGEEIFQAQLDQVLAEEAGRAVAHGGVNGAHVVGVRVTGTELVGAT